MSTSQSTPKNKIESLRAQLQKNSEEIENQIQKELENVKVELATQLDAAAQTFKYLIECGATDVLSEQKFSDAVRVLGIKVKSPRNKTRAKAKGKQGTTKKKMSVKDAILKVLSSGKEMDTDEIFPKVSKLRGKKTPKSTVAQTLSELANQNRIQRVTPGVYKNK